MFDFVYCFRLNVFTIKISDLLFPLGTEVAEGRESYPPNDVTNKYICDAFSMICLSILSLLFLALQRS